jgi:hypothetical protein
MNATTESSPGRILALRGRETATEAMIRQIDGKLARLGSARRDRANALKKIRCELARSFVAGQVASDRHEQLL